MYTQETVIDITQSMQGKPDGHYAGIKRHVRLRCVIQYANHRINQYAESHQCDSRHPVSTTQHFTGYKFLMGKLLEIGSTDDVGQSHQWRCNRKCQGVKTDFRIVRSKYAQTYSRNVLYRHVGQRTKIDLKSVTLVFSIQFFE